MRVDETGLHDIYVDCLINTKILFISRHYKRQNIAYMSYIHIYIYNNYNVLQKCIFWIYIHTSGCMVNAVECEANNCVGSISGLDS